MESTARAQPLLLCTCWPMNKTYCSFWQKSGPLEVLSSAVGVLRMDRCASLPLHAVVVALQGFSAGAVQAPSHVSSCSCL